MPIFFLFTKAFIAGLIICAVIGPIAILFMNKTIEYGIKGALAVGIGAALADGLCGSIAAFSLSTISEFIQREASIIKILGGILLIFLSYKDLSNKISPKEVKIKSSGFYRLILEVFILTAISPITIGGFVAIFSTLDTIHNGIDDMLIMTLGVFIGSITWWIILGMIILKMKDRLSGDWLVKIRYISSITIGVFGIAAIINGIIS